MRHADTDVRRQEREEPNDDTTAPSGRVPHGWAGQRLGEWQRTELRIARGFAECRGLGVEQLEDIYQETAVALLTRRYSSEEHLRNALRHGIKHRALNMHRDTRRRTQILQNSAPSMQRVAEARQSDHAPEEAALVEQDRLVVREFLTELDELEQRVFLLFADGMRYRAIAKALEIPVNEARNASRSCERKRQRFQLLYDTGRLCGYRAATIQALQGGEVTTNELAARAFAHLEGCSSCRTEHRTNAKRLGRTVRDQISAVLTLPALLARLASLRHPWGRTGMCTAGGLRERTVGVIGAAGAGAKLTAGAVTVAVLAGGTIDATHALGHHGHAARQRRPARAETHRAAALAKEPVLGERDGIIGHAAAHGRQPRPHRGRAARNAAGEEATEREFALRATPAAAADRGEPVADRPTAGDAAQREFGIEPNGG
jgi:RNA polymerase sigma factor (sigma-70 family)